MGEFNTLSYRAGAIGYPFILCPGIVLTFNNFTGGQGVIILATPRSREHDLGVASSTYAQYSDSKQGCKSASLCGLFCVHVGRNNMDAVLHCTVGANSDPAAFFIKNDHTIWYISFSKYRVLSRVRNTECSKIRTSTTLGKSNNGNTCD